MECGKTVGGHIAAETVSQSGYYGFFTTYVEIKAGCIPACVSEHVPVLVVLGVAQITEQESAHVQIP